MVGRFHILLVSCSCLTAAAVSQVESETPSSVESKEEAILKRVLPISQQAGKILRLYYVVDCHASDSVTPFPNVKVRPPSPNHTGLDAIREIFTDDRNVSVVESPSDIIRISIGKVPTEVLQTRLSSVTFDRNERYDVPLAISAIERTKEMAAARKRLGVDGPLIFTGGVQAPIRGLPHLPKRLKDVTADEALDIVAKTWRDGAVVYGICSDQSERDKQGNKTYWIGFDEPLL